MEVYNYFEKDPNVSLLSFRKGDEIIAEGMNARHMFIIRNGFVLPNRISQDGQTKVGLGFAGPNWILGTEIIEEGQSVYENNLTALSDCNLLEFSVPTFLRIFRENPNLRDILIIQFLKQEAITRELEYGMHYSAGRRVALSIRQISNEVGRTLVGIPDHIIGANAGGISRATTNKIIVELKKMGVVSSREQRSNIYLRITDPDRLMDIANGLVAAPKYIYKYR